MSKPIPTPLSSRRPSSGVSLSNRLAALESWTEEPTIVAFEEMKPKPAEVEADIPATVKKPSSKPKKAVGEVVAEQMLPWIDASEDKLAVFMFKPSEALHLKLKFLGETTYGMTMQKIVVEAVEQRVAALLKARGIG